MREEALRYHAEGQPGKIAVVPTKPLTSQHDFSLAYSPGVAEPCLEIVKNPLDAYKYTGKGNLVAVVTNGTAVLGLGNIGALAGKPVMEGKSMLFKVFADIDAFDIEVNATDTDRFVETVKAIAPTFGGINLEDIKAPECFEIEARLREALDIPGDPSCHTVSNLRSSRSRCWSCSRMVWCRTAAGRSSLLRSCIYCRAFLVE